MRTVILSLLLACGPDGETVCGEGFLDDGTGTCVPEESADCPTGFAMTSDGLCIEVPGAGTGTNTPTGPGTGTGTDTTTSGTPTDTGTGTGGSGSTTGTGGTTTCTNGVVSQSPLDGAVDVFYGTTVEYRLERESAAASISLETAAGVPVAGASSIDGVVITFETDAPLEPSESYTARLDYPPCSPVESTWTVGDDAGGSIDARRLDGRTYAMDLAAGSWIDPVGLGDLFGALLTDTPLLGVQASGPDDIGLILAWADASGAAQDLCLPTTELDSVDFSDNPIFWAETSRIDMNVDGFDLVLDDADLSGAFTEDLSAAVGVSLVADFDTRPLVDLIAPGGGDDAICILMATFGVSCVECDDGAGPYCLTMRVQEVPAGEIPRLTLEPRSPAEIAADPLCD